MPAGPTFRVRGVKQDSSVITIGDFNSFDAAEQNGDDLVASGYFVSYVILEYPVGGGEPIEHDQT